MRKRGLVPAIIFVLFTLIPAYAGDIQFIRLNKPPEPRLLYPIYDTVTLTGNAPLEFRWFNDYLGIDHFIFKIYKGYNMYASGLIYKQNIPSGDSSLKLKADLFENGQVYTWSLIQVALGGEKSDKSFNSFRVIKSYTQR